MSNMWISPDNKIHKLIVLEGDWGTKPAEHSECIISISDCLELSDYNNSTVIIGDSSNYLERILDKCLITMNAKEVAKFTILPENINFTLKLEQVKFDGYIHQWNNEKKFEISLKHKEKGVELFKLNRAKDAAYRFTKGLKIISSIPIDVENTPLEIDGVKVEDISALKANLYNNLASYYFKNQAWMLTIDICKKVLEFDSTNIKAHYKLAVAYMKDRNFDAAEKEFDIVLKGEPHNKAAIEHMKYVKEEIMKANHNFNLLVKKMFH